MAKTRKNVPTQQVTGPESELVYGLSSQRFVLGLMADPLLHYWRATTWATRSTTQPFSLCGRRIAFGKHFVPADRKVCPVCRWKAAYQMRTGIWK